MCALELRKVERGGRGGRAPPLLTLAAAAESEVHCRAKGESWNAVLMDRRVLVGPECGILLAGIYLSELSGANT